MKKKILDNTIDVSVEVSSHISSYVVKCVKRGIEPNGLMLASYLHKFYDISEVSTSIMNKILANHLKNSLTPHSDTHFATKQKIRLLPSAKVAHYSGGHVQDSIDERANARKRLKAQKKQEELSKGIVSSLLSNGSIIPYVFAIFPKYSVANSKGYNNGIRQLKSELHRLKVDGVVICQTLRTLQTLCKLFSYAYENNFTFDSEQLAMQASAVQTDNNEIAYQHKLFKPRLSNDVDVNSFMKSDFNPFYHCVITGESLKPAIVDCELTDMSHFMIAHDGDYATINAVVSKFFTIERVYLNVAVLKYILDKKVNTNSVYFGKAILSQIVVNL